MKQKKYCLMCLLLCLLLCLGACSKEAADKTGSAAVIGGIEDSIRAETLSSFAYQYSDSAGIYYLGNGQTVEYFNKGSYADFVTAFDSLSSSGQLEQAAIFDGRFFLVEGTAENITDEQLTVSCDNGDSTSCKCVAVIVSEQQSVLSEIDDGDSVTVLVKLSGYSYTGAKAFSGHSGIIAEINGANQSVPVFDYSLDGITAYGDVPARNTETEDSGAEPSDESKDENDTEDNTEDNTDEPEPVVEEINYPSAGLFRTEFYTVVIPDDWYGRYTYDRWELDSYGYGIGFNEASSAEDGMSGRLFSICLQTDQSYLTAPDYNYIGQIAANNGLTYNVVVYYPTSIEFSTAARADYNDMGNDIDAIVASLAATDIATFTAGTPVTPISQDDWTNIPVKDRLTNADAYILPSSTRYITLDDMEGFDYYDATYAKNELYARHGCTFKVDFIKDYFMSKSWYVPNSSLIATEYPRSNFNDYESANLDVILQYISLHNLTQDNIYP